MCIKSEHILWVLASIQKHWHLATLLTIISWNFQLWRQTQMQKKKKVASLLYSLWFINKKKESLSKWVVQSLKLYKSLLSIFDSHIFAVMKLNQNTVKIQSLILFLLFKFQQYAIEFSRKPNKVAFMPHVLNYKKNWEKMLNE